MRPTHWWVRTVLTRLDGEMPTQTLQTWSEIVGNHAPHALHLGADQAHRAGVSAFDEDAPSATGYLLDRLPLADALAVADAEPNSTLADAVGVAGLPAIVQGEVDLADATPVTILTLGGSVDGIEDLVRLDDRQAGAALLVFDADADLDLYLLTVVLPRSDETLYLGVTRFDSIAGPPTPYTLYIAPL